MPETVIKVNKVGKRYNLDAQDKYHTLRDFISETLKKTFSKGVKRSKRKNFWALKNISFEVKKGEVLGIIGRNGAGKSTLLKVLARIIPPTDGYAVIKGRVASLLEVGTGFHQELTGRENVFISGAILGMKKKEIVKKFDDIVKFSEIGKFLDVPVKRYSSGMQVRLAFSVAVHLDSDVLLIDEVLAVGDLSFQRKSLKKMHSIAKDEGRTVVFVSHNTSAVDALCDKVALLEKGRLINIGKPREILSEYITDYVPDEKSKLLKGTIRGGNGKIRTEDFWIEDEKGIKMAMAKSGEECSFVFKYLCPSGKEEKGVDFGFAVTTLIDQPIFLEYFSFYGEGLRRCPPKGTFKFKFKKFPLAPGQYKIGIRAIVQGKEADYIPRFAQFNVEDGDFFKTGFATGQTHSPIFVEGEWELKKLHEG